MIFDSGDTGDSGGYQAPRSLRLRSSASAYLGRTPASQPTTWTCSFWVKRGTVGANQAILVSRKNAVGSGGIEFTTGDNLNVFNFTSAGTTNAKFRDPSAWYHFVVNWSGTSAAVVYCNGVQQTLSSNTSGSSNIFTSTWTNCIGNFGDANSAYLDGYLSEVNFIDGQALTPASFGETSATTGQWQAKKYGGTYGTNGFYLPFSDTTSTTTLCYDASGNANHWTPSGISLTAGATYDSMTDVPLGGGGSLGNGQGNYCVLNPLAASGTLSNGNLNAVVTAGGGNTVDSTIAVLSGKYYCECTYTGGSAQAIQIGVARGADFKVSGSSGVAYYSVTGQKVIDGTVTAYGATFTYGDVIGIALDADGGTVTFYKNNVSQGAITLPTSTSGWKFVFGNNTGAGTQTLDLTFGQRPFTYTPPTGFKALCTSNLPAVTVQQPKKHFDAVPYVGNGSTKNVTGAAFQPDFVWVKDRTAAQAHNLFDVIRGATKVLYSHLTNAEGTDATSLTSFNSDGFTLGNGANDNTNGNNYASWLWKANGAGVTNNAGSITSTVSANTAAGFSIVTYTGTSSTATQTIGHGLGVAPKLIIVKNRSGVYAWPVYHANMAASVPHTWYMTLNGTAAASNGVSIWQAAPTSSVFSLNGSVAPEVWANTNNYVAYCFAEVPGFSKFGSYTGNGSADGPFVYCGFRPRWILVKQSGAVGNWVLHDTSRDTYNTTVKDLYPNLSDAEATTPYPSDILSNGFKLRGTGGDWNASGGTYIFAAFAESPFQSALAR